MGTVTHPRTLSPLQPGGPFALQRPKKRMRRMFGLLLWADASDIFDFDCDQRLSKPQHMEINNLLLAFVSGRNLDRSDGLDTKVKF